VIQSNCDQQIVIQKAQMKPSIHIQSFLHDSILQNLIESYKIITLATNGQIHQSSYFQLVSGTDPSPVHSLEWR